MISIFYKNQPYAFYEISGVLEAGGPNPLFKKLCDSTTLSYDSFEELRAPLVRRSFQESEVWKPTNDSDDVTIVKSSAAL